MERLKSHRDFVAVLKKRRKVGGHDVIVHVRLQPPAAGGEERRRMGLAVSKNVGNAVHRNAVKRRFRVIARAHEAQLPANCDIVLRAKPSAARASFQALDDQIGTLFTKIGQMADQS